MMLVLGLGPLIAAVPADALALGFEAGLKAGLTGKVDDASVPACCRRNGKHHCVMTSQSLASGEIAISAKADCPCMPQALATAVPQIAAILQAANSSMAFLAEAYTHQTRTVCARTNGLRIWPKRGPPASQSL